jgi:dsDNA-specific endonuclease/ATPase MutS2
MSLRWDFTSRRVSMAEMTDGMRSLSEDILSGSDERKRKIKELKADAMSMRWEARRFLDAARNSREATSKEMRKGLERGRMELSQHVKDMREDFQTREKAVRDDLAEARRVWGAMRDTLRSRSK